VRRVPGPDLVPVPNLQLAAAWPLVLGSPAHQEGQEPPCRSTDRPRQEHRPLPALDPQPRPPSATSTRRLADVDRDVTAGVPLPADRRGPAMARAAQAKDREQPGRQGADERRDDAGA
jgi:hypothetical protein